METPRTTDGQRAARRPKQGSWLDGDALRRSSAPEALRSVLREADYTEPAVEKRLAGGLLQGGPDLPLLLRRLAGDDRLDRLIRLFCLGDALGESDVAGLLGRDLAGSMLRLGLLRRRGGDVAATLMIAPSQDVWVASDFPGFRRDGTMGAGYVPGVSALSATLVRLAVRRRVSSALDVGAGNGIQAFAASRHARNVVGTDTNPRALACAVLGAELNGIANVEWREGSFFEPVQGERFDLVVANPPFVVSPETQYLFRDGGSEGDGVAELVVRGVARHLAPGGFGFVALNWLHEAEGDWALGPRRWLEGAECDAWLLHSDSLDSLGYAAHWLRQTERDDPGAYGRRLDAWTAYFRSLSVEAIGMGVIVLRKRPGASNWFRTISVRGDALGDRCGEHIERVFEAEDLLQALPDEAALLGLRLEVHPDHLLESVQVIRDGERRVESLRLRRTRGIRIQGDVDEPVVRLLLACDGRRTLREVADGLAADMELDVASAERAVLTIAGNLLRSGVLVPSAEA